MSNELLTVYIPTGETDIDKIQTKVNEWDEEEGYWGIGLAVEKKVGYFISESEWKELYLINEVKEDNFTDEEFDLIPDMGEVIPDGEDDDLVEKLAEEDETIKSWQESGIDCAESADMKKVFKAGYKAAQCDTNAELRKVIEYLDDTTIIIPGLRKLIGSLMK